MKRHFESCPVCKSSKHEIISASHESFHMWSCGYVPLNVCLECGCVYLPNAHLDTAQKKYREREKKYKER